MGKRFYLDINCRTGRSCAPTPQFPYTMGELLDDMSYCHIHGAAILNRESLEYSYVAGNQKLLDIQNPRLYPIAAVCSSAAFETDGSADSLAYFERLVHGGAKGFYFSPKSFHEPFSPFFLSQLAPFMAEAQLPAFIDAGEISPDALLDVLTVYTELNVVLLNVTRSWNRALFAMMERFQNLWFEISQNQSFGLLELCRKRFGLQRVLFGTGYPYKSPGAMKAMVEYANITEAEKDLVAYKNACRLLGVDATSLSSYSENDCRLDEIAKKVDEGEPLHDIWVIDAHVHMLDAAHKTTTGDMRLNLDIDSLVAKMDRMGVDLAVVSPWEGLLTDGLAANLTAMAVAYKHPQRFAFYACVNPNYQEDLSGILAQHEAYSFCGIKPYWYAHQSDLLSEKYEPWFAYANAHKLCCLIHGSDAATANKTVELAGRYPQMTFILAHSGTSYVLADLHIQAAQNRENILLDFTFTTLTYGIIEYLVSQIGADRIVYGTDTGVRDPAPQLGWVAYAKIDEEDKKKILGGNMQRVFDAMNS